MKINKKIINKTMESKMLDTLTNNIQGYYKFKDDDEDGDIWMIYNMFVKKSDDFINVSFVDKHNISYTYDGKITELDNGLLLDLYKK